MKTRNILALLLALAMVFCLCACGVEKPAEEPAPAAEDAAPAPAAEEETAAEDAAPVATEVRGVTCPAFSVTVNGITVDNDMMAAYPLYSVDASSVNSSGTASTVNFIGFAMKDVFDAAGLTEQYIWLEATADDGYAVTYTDDLFADITLLAISKDGTQFKSSPWFAPCGSKTTGDYLMGCVSILVNTVEEAPEIVVPAAEETAEAAAPELTAPDKQDKTDKVTFGDYSFKINGEEVNNAKLEGLSIYKVTVVTENASGATAESTYTGYVLADVLKACGIENPASVTVVANDGYKVELTAEQIASEYTIVAIECNKETGEDGTIWIAPCTETSSKAYCKLVVELICG